MNLTYSTPVSPLSSAKPCNIFWNKHYSDGSKEQRFFKNFPIRTSAFQKMCADDVVCSSLGLNELSKDLIFKHLPIWISFQLPCKFNMMKCTTTQQNNS
jgi:hypothetical protein